MRMRTAALAAACLLTLPAARHRAINIGVQLSAERSFIITDKPILETFTFERVLDTLVARSGATGLTSAQLYRQWFDTQNPKPGLADPAGPHCDDVVAGGIPTLNGYARRCPTLEGPLAAQPFTSGEYFPIEIVNRFDMAPQNGANCGQYRIVFARKSSKLHAIFEAFLPNPHPETGIAGCSAVAQFWAGLSGISSLEERRAKLETFFFDGLPGFEPVVVPEHYASPGGIRTLQISTTVEMLQFRIARQCASGTCMMRVVPDALENAPFGAYLDASDQSDRATRFRAEFLAQIPNLAIPDVNGYFIRVPNEYLIGDIAPSDTGTPPFTYAFQFGRNNSPAAADEYRARVQAELAKVGSTLTPEQVVSRAETLHCVGCHFFGGTDIGDGLEFPGSSAFGEHVTEVLRDGEAGAGTRYSVSPAVEQVFVPNRMKILKAFLLNGTAPAHSQSHPDMPGRE